MVLGFGCFCFAFNRVLWFGEVDGWVPKGSIQASYSFDSVISFVDLRQEIGCGVPSQESLC